MADPNPIALHYIKMYEREDAADMPFKSGLWQPAADLILPRMNKISGSRSPGHLSENEIFNSTAMLAAEDMASGLSGMMIPHGQTFFAVRVGNQEQTANSRVGRYLAFLTERAHELIFESNFISQFNEALLSFCVFGPCNLFSEFDIEANSLHYLSFDIGTYTVVRDSRLRIMAIMVKWKIPACEAVRLFGVDNAGQQVVRAAQTPETEFQEFEYLHVVEPRSRYNPHVPQMYLNMPYKSLWIAMKDMQVSKEGGYLSNPYAISNWRKSQTEKWGRGRGIMALPAVRQLEQMEIDLTECGNKWNNPPLEVLESFDGNVRVTPGAENRVTEMNSIRAIVGEAKGSFPITREMVQRKEEEIKEIFLGKVFRQFIDMEGDRRTTVEIRERKNQALRIIGAPILNAYNEILTPTISRSILLLIRHGKIVFEGNPNPPDELSGVNFGIEYLGELALALRDQQARGFVQWAGFLGQMGQAFPDSHIEDYIALERAVPRMGTAFGIGSQDIATEEEVEQKKQARQQMLQLQQTAEMANAAGGVYKNLTASPQPDSAAENIQDMLR